MAGAGYKSFTSGDILTASQVNTYLMQQAVMAFATSAARGSAITSPSEGMASYLLDSNSVEVYDASAWKRIANTTGSVLQVVTASYSTSTNNLTSTYADTGLTASITPSSSSNKIFVLVNQAGCGKLGASNAATTLELQLLRGATAMTNHGGIAYTGASQQVVIGSQAFMYLDSPATTSSTTYKTQFKNSVNANGVVVQNNSGAANVSTITLLEISA